MHKYERRVLLPQDLKPINSLEEYKKQGGLVGLEKARQMSTEDMVAQLKASGLRGRGGAGFPTFIKWDTVSKDPSIVKYVVCNAAEGEPGTYKDRYMFLKNPYQVFEGMLIAAHAVGAKAAVMGTKEKFKPQVERLQSAIKEMEDAGVMQKGYLELILGPDEYLFGEEKALLEVLDGRDAMPRNFPPYMLGIRFTPNDCNPTVVNNVETMAHLSNIFANGVDAFRSNGTEDTPGTGIVSLSGDVKNPGMYEISFGLTVRELLYEIGGGPRDGREFKAIFSGVSNKVMTPDQFDLTVDFGSLRADGVGYGSGGFMVYDDTRSMLDVTWMFSKFLAMSSCGQCVPCNMGTRVITEHLRKLKDGEGSEEDLKAIIDETERCTNQTRCFLPVQESVVIPSIMKKFPQEFEAAARKEFGDFDRDVPVPKVQSYDEEKGLFVYEAHPKEFIGVPMFASR